MQRRLSRRESESRNNNKGEQVQIKSTEIINCLDNVDYSIACFCARPPMPIARIPPIIQTVADNICTEFAICCDRDCQSLEEVVSIAKYTKKPPIRKHSTLNTMETGCANMTNNECNTEIKISQQKTTVKLPKSANLIKIRNG